MNTATCAKPGLVCCPPAIFQPPPPGFATQLAGLLWLMPCVGNVTWHLPFACDTQDPPDAITQLVGDPSELYDVTLLIRGVFETATYTGGTVIPGTNSMMIQGGSPVLDGHNVASLIISNPAATYYMNRWDVSQGLNYNVVYAIRYTGVIQIAGGATVTLRYQGINGGEITNSTNAVITPLAGEPPLNPLVMPQPYGQNDQFGQGQFLQMDCLGIA